MVKKDFQAIISHQSKRWVTHAIYVFTIDNSPTFVTISRAEVLDVTLCSGGMACVRKTIVFGTSAHNLNERDKLARKCNVPQKVSQGKYGSGGGIEALELAVDQQPEDITTAYIEICPEKIKQHKALKQCGGIYVCILLCIFIKNIQSNIY